MEAVHELQGYFVEMETSIGEQGEMDAWLSATAAGLMEGTWEVEREWTEVEETAVSLGYTLVPGAETAIAAGDAWEQARALESRLAVHPAVVATAVTPVSALLGGMGRIEAEAPNAIGAPDGALLFAMPFPPQACDPLQLSLQDPQWHLCLTRTLEARTLFGTLGNGLSIGHPDTGYTPHDQLLDAPADRLRSADGFNCAEPASPDPLDPLRGGPLRFPGHGTATASVGISGAAPVVNGAVPEAELIPFRVANTVALAMRRHRRSLACAVKLAVDAGCEVISISMGWLTGHPDLHAEIQRAQREGVIVVAAAGQVQFTALPIRPPVIFPARYPETIAVAAGDINGQGVNWSARGASIDVTAPGENVWRARASGTNIEVSPGSGTSYATPQVAGIALMWLERWQPELAALEAQRGDRAFRTDLFRHVLNQCGLTSLGPGWGAGLIDAVRVLTYDWPAEMALGHIMLLSAPAPGDAPQPVMMDASPAMEAEWVELGLLVDPALVGNVDSATLAEAMQRATADLFAVEAADFPAFYRTFGDEIAFQLLYNPDQRAAYRERVQHYLSPPTDETETGGPAPHPFPAGDAADHVASPPQFMHTASPSLRAHVR